MMVQNLSEETSVNMPARSSQQAGLLHQSTSGLQDASGAMNLQSVSPVQPVISSTPKARLQCHACNLLLEYDAGAQYVQVCFKKKLTATHVCLFFFFLLVFWM